MTEQQKEYFDIIRHETAAAKATLVAVSKTRPISAIQEFYELGQRDFGENRVPEMLEKAKSLPNDIRWHFIGHLQRNKVKDLIGHVDVLHSVDSERLLLEVNKQAVKAGRVVDVLLQFHIAQEESKYGLTSEVAKSFLPQYQQSEALPGVRIIGVMGMATFTDIDEQIATEFDRLVEIYEELKSTFFADKTEFCEISMGMSGDYPLALAKGSTMIRVGSLLFGKRNYG